MQAKNGELAIVIFDDKEHVCFVTGRDKSQTKIVRWNHRANHTIMLPSVVPKNLVTKAVVKTESRHLILDGQFCKLTIDDVEPGVIYNKNEETSDVKLGGCYHTGKAYCLGYRTGQGEEIELDDGVFTCLDSGVDGGAVEGLKKHREDFNPSEDIPRFIVELAAVRIIDEKDDDKDCECGSHSDDCSCDDDSGMGEYCLDCGEYDDECLCYEDDTICECGYHEEDCCCDTDEFDDENVDRTFHKMNAFARARWLKASS